MAPFSRRAQAVAFGLIYFGYVACLIVKCVPPPANNTVVLQTSHSPSSSPPPIPPSSPA